jgi:hypothetical protein
MALIQIKPALSGRVRPL